MYDRETAALDGVDDCGACGRMSYDSRPSVTPSNIVISAGNTKDLGDVGRHIELHAAHGFHTTNLTTGDIGIEASTAFLVENGKRTPIRGFMITGNVFDMFGRIEAIESRVNTNGSFTAPRIAFSGVQIV